MGIKPGPASNLSYLSKKGKVKVGLGHCSGLLLVILKVRSHLLSFVTFPEVVGQVMLDVFSELFSEFRIESKNLDQA